MLIHQAPLYQREPLSTSDESNEPQKIPTIVVWHPELSTILTTDIGAGTIIHSHVWIGDIKIGKNCRIQAFCFIPDWVTIEDNVFLGPRVTFTNDKHPPSFGKHWARTLVKKGASVGASATILPGVTIGENAVVGAGALVTKNIPDGETWAGVPAKRLVGP